MIHSPKSGRALVPNGRAPQGNAGGISLPAGTGTSVTGTAPGTGTGIGGGTGTDTGAPTSTTSGSDSGTSPTGISQSTSSTTTSDPVSNASTTSPTTAVPSTTILSSTTSSSSTNTSTSMPPPLSLTDSRHPFTTSTIQSTFVSTQSDGGVQSFTTPIPTALVSSSPDSSSMNHTTMIVASTVSAFVLLVLLILAALFIWRRKGLKVRTRMEEQNEREKGKETRRLLEDEDFAVDDEDRWSWLGQNRNLAPSLNSGIGGPISLLQQGSEKQLPLLPQTAVHARTSSNSTFSYSPPSSIRRPSSSNSTLRPPPSPLGTLRGQTRSSLQLTPVPSSSSWISRPVSATLPPYKDPFGVGPPLHQVTFSGVSPKLPVTKTPLSPPAKSFVASPQSYQSPSEWLRSPTSPTFAQAAAAAAITTTTADTPTPAATDADTTSQGPTLQKKHSTAVSVDSIASSVSEYSQESAPLHVLSSRLAGRSESLPPVPPIPLMPLRSR